MRGPADEETTQSAKEEQEKEEKATIIEKVEPMAVYIGQLFEAQVYGGNWQYGQACHLYGDTLDELHDFAMRLKLKRSWFQGRNIPHYDLTRNKRREAVKLGAIELSFREEGLKIRELRLKGRAQ